jgi:predicted acylesterase/phospholipase RssA
MLWDDAMSDTEPLWKLIYRYANQDMLDAIGREYAKGRLVLIGTTDLDAGRPVIWNIGAIGASYQPQALDLFRNILLASAAIPAAFPPVLIDMGVNAKRYQEMHVDGVDYNLAYIGPDFTMNAKNEFDPTFTRALYD